jgi:hypothetical protein
VCSKNVFLVFVEILVFLVFLVFLRLDTGANALLVSEGFLGESPKNTRRSTEESHVCFLLSDIKSIC